MVVKYCNTIKNASNNIVRFGWIFAYNFIRSYICLNKVIDEFNGFDKKELCFHKHSVAIIIA